MRSGNIKWCDENVNETRVERDGGVGEMKVKRNKVNVLQEVNLTIRWNKTSERWQMEMRWGWVEEERTLCLVVSVLRSILYGWFWEAPVVWGEVAEKGSWEWEERERGEKERVNVSRSSSSQLHSALMEWMIQAAGRLPLIQMAFYYYYRTHFSAYSVPWVVFSLYQLLQLYQAYKIEVTRISHHYHLVIYSSVYLFFLHHVSRLWPEFHQIMLLYVKDNG